MISFAFEFLFIVYFLIAENCYNSRTRVYSAKSLDWGLLLDLNLGRNTVDFACFVAKYIFGVA